MKQGICIGFWKRLIWLAASLLILSSSQSTFAGPLDQWHWRNPLPQGNRILGLIYTNGAYVAVGDLGTILTSPDGTNWMRCDSGTTVSLHRCAFGGGQYVIVGDYGMILTSTNLVTWTERSAGTFYSLNGITYDGSQFIAVGDGTTIITSPDGSHWTNRSSGPWSLIDVTYAAGTYVAVGGTLDSSSGPVSGVILSSSDGAEWSLQTIVTYIPFLSVAHGPNGFVAGGSATYYQSPSAVWVSSNGMDWASTASSPTTVSQIAYLQGKWLTGAGPVFDYSTYSSPYGDISVFQDLETWSDVATSTGGITGFAAGNGLIVAATGTGTFLVSTDGLSWTNPWPAPAALNFADLKYLNGSFVGVGSAAFSFSVDGITWTNAATPTSGLTSITYGNGRYVAGGQSRSVWTSTDGVNWTNPAPDLELYPYVADEHVAFGKGVFVGASGYSADILTSPDGLNWTAQELTNSPGSVYFSDIAFGNGIFIAVSPQIFATSIDGTNWLVSPAPSVNVTAVAAGNGKFVAVGASTIMTSTDGTNWTTQVSSEFGTLSKVAFGGGFFVALDTQFYYQLPKEESLIWISTDGIHWVKRHSNTYQGLTTLAFGDGAFLVNGWNSTILQSDPIITLSLNLAGVPQLMVDGPLNQSLRIDYTSNFSATNQWIPLTNITISKNPTTFTDGSWTNSPERFYRAMAVQ